jgi:predicted amidohydrolase YtcJ
MISYLIKNCKIYENKGNSILVENNIIKNIGTNLKPVGKLPVIDLKNKYIYPGFTDAHLHSFTSSQMAKYVDLSNCKSDKELISTIEKFIKVNKIGNGKMVVGVKYAHDLVPTSKLLDYFKNNPIYIIRVCLHIAVANKLAIKLVKHVNNENGVYKEDAIIKYLEGLPPLSLKDTEKALFDYFHYLKAQGNTYLQSNDIDNPYKKSTVYKALLNLNKNNKLPVHIYEQVVARNENDVKQAIELIKTTPKTEKLTFYSVKLFADGSLGAKTAYMLKPYENSKNQGKLNHSTKEMYKMISLVNKARIPCAIHAIGDGAVEQVISCYERLSKIYARNTLIHVQTGNIKQYQRIKKLGLNICFQPQFISSEYPMVLERIGKAREKTSYALGS